LITGIRFQRKREKKCLLPLGLLEAKKNISKATGSFKGGKMITGGDYLKIKIHHKRVYKKVIKMKPWSRKRRR